MKDGGRMTNERLSELRHKGYITNEEYNELKQKVGEWIPFTKRPMTEEEREHYTEWSDMNIDDFMIFDCPLPEDGQEVLISYGGMVMIDVFIRDETDGCYFESAEIDDVEAWMPLPEGYRGE